MADELVQVEFTERHGRWTAGDRAGFTPEKAAELVGAGVACYAGERSGRRPWWSRLRDPDPEVEDAAEEAEAEEATRHITAEDLAAGGGAWLPEADGAVPGGSPGGWPWRWRSVGERPPWLRWIH